MNATVCKLLGAGALALLCAARGFSYTYVTPVSVWQPGSIPMQIKMATTPALTDGTNYATSVQTAMTTWNSVLGVVQFTSQIMAADMTSSNNSINEIVFASTVEGDAFGTGILAVTLSSHYPSVHQRAESDILFNTAYTWDSYRGPLQASQDIRRVALHELGHSLGLNHPDDDGQTVTAVMNSHASGVDTITADDIAGAQSLYNAPGATTAPPNDNFVNATTIVLSSNTAQVTGSNIFATKESGEPKHAGFNGGRSAWWKWTATGNGSLVINADGSRFDTLMGVYTGAAVNVLATIASNDDFSNGTISYSYITMNVVSGTVYWIAVDGFDAASGLVMLTLNFTPAGTITPPVFTSNPANASVVVGGTAQFSAAVTGFPAPTFQWQRLPAGSGTWANLSNGGSYAGVTSTTLGVTSTAGINGDQFRCVATNSAGSATSGAGTLSVSATVDVGRLINLSVRSNAGTDAQTLIVGLVVGGTGTSGTKPVLIRGVGPTLAGFGVPGALSDTIMELYRQSSPTPLASNNDWGGDAQVTAVGNAVGAFSLSSATSKDAALYTSLPNEVYSVKVLGAAGTTGIALAEIYDATPAGTALATTPRLVNVSARTQVGTGDAVLIAGFVIGGSSPCTVMIRGVGPTLSGFGVPGAIADPQLTLFQRVNGVDSQIAFNDDWGQAANATSIQPTAAQVGAFSLSIGSKDAVLLITLQPGVYSAKLSGVNNITGIGLVEVYEVP